MRTTTIFALAALALLAACSSTKTNDTADAGPAGGPKPGAPSAHCALPDGGRTVQPTDPAACHPDASAPADAGQGGRGGDDAGDNPYGDTMPGDQGDDDDCKYHVAWSATAIRTGADVTFTLTATSLATGAPAQAASPRAEVYLNDTHPAPNTDQKATEIAPGKYTLGPIRFDASGEWTVRFHLYEDCVDLSPDSPHGHAAFFVEVP